MKSFVLILSFLLFVSAITCISTNWRSDDEVIALYEEWLVKHQKLHFSLGEKIKRFEIFKDNLRYIDEQNNYNKVNYKNFTLGLNQFADLTFDEFSSMYLGVNADYEQIISSNPDHDDDQKYFSREGVAEFPCYVDWREQGVVFPIRNQGTCGSCWTFSAIASIETLIAIKYGRLIALSEQELLDCEEKSYGCKGGFYDSAFQYVIDNGISTRDKYPYLFQEGQCQKMEKKVKISGYKKVPRNNEELLQSAVTEQVVSVTIKSSKAMQFYQWGIFYGACGSKSDHAMNIVGYGSEGKSNYWIVRNSWGLGWGEKGYIRIPRNLKQQNHSYCGIAELPSYPVINVKSSKFM